MLSPRQIQSPTDAQIEHSAYNAAFYELGLRWHWDEATYDRLAQVRCERSRLQHYLETAQPHLLRAYDAEFLTDAILQAKERSQRALAQCATGSVHRFDWTCTRCALLELRFPQCPVLLHFGGFRSISRSGNQ